MWKVDHMERHNCSLILHGSRDMPSNALDVCVHAAGTQAGCATEGGPQTALEALRKALEREGDAPAARRLSMTPGKGRRKGGMAVVVLDEMDQLLSADQGVLYDLFRLPQACPYAASCSSFSSCADSSVDSLLSLGMNRLPHQDCSCTVGL